MKALILCVMAAATLAGCSPKQTAQQQQQQAWDEWNKTHLTEGQTWKP